LPRHYDALIPSIYHAQEPIVCYVIHIWCRYNKREETTILQRQVLSVLAGQCTTQRKSVNSASTAFTRISSVQDFEPLHANIPLGLPETELMPALITETTHRRQASVGTTMRASLATTRNPARENVRNESLRRYPPTQLPRRVSLPSSVASGCGCARNPIVMMWGR